MKRNKRLFFSEAKNVFKRGLDRCEDSTDITDSALNAAKCQKTLGKYRSKSSTQWKSCFAFAESYDYLNLEEELRVKKCHLFGQMLGLEVAERGLSDRDVDGGQEDGRRVEPRLALIHLLDALGPQDLGQRQITSVDQLVDEVHQNPEHFVAAVARTVTEEGTD